MTSRGPLDPRTNEYGSIYELTPDDAPPRPTGPVPAWLIEQGDLVLAAQDPKHPAHDEAVAEVARRMRGGFGG